MLTVVLPHALPRHLSYRNHERVMLLVGEATDDTYTVRILVPVRNEHQNPAHHFAVSEEQVRMMVGDTSLVIGVLHTHPIYEPDPSDNDLANIPYGWLGGVVCGRHVSSWYQRGQVAEVKLTYDANDALLYTA